MLGAMDSKAQDPDKILDWEFLEVSEWMCK